MSCAYFFIIKNRYTYQETDKSIRCYSYSGLLSVTESKEYKICKDTSDSKIIYNYYRVQFIC